MKASARYKNETWCIDMAYLDKLAKVDKGLKNPPVRRKLFERTVHRKRMKTKGS